VRGDERASRVQLVLALGPQVAGFGIARSGLIPLPTRRPR